MSDTPRLADEALKLVDNGHYVVLRSCGLGSVLAVCVKKNSPAFEALDEAVDRALGWDGEEPDDGESKEFGDNAPGVVETDDFSVSQALYRLTEKAVFGRIA